MADNAEYLKVIFTKDNLNKTDVVNLLAGHRIIRDRAYGDGSKAYDLITGQQVAKSKTKDIVERWRSLKEIWESSTHDRSAINLHFDPQADDLLVPRNYALQWAWQKHKGTDQLFEGFRECIRYALEQQWITPQDYERVPVVLPAGETPKEPVKEKPKEQEPTQEELGETKEENLLRLIGILKNMLADEDVIKDLKKDPSFFSKQKDLVQYISGLYGEDHPNKGLEKTTVDETFSSANKVLKDDENP
jgi:hypothetical protein